MISRQYRVCILQRLLLSFRVVPIDQPSLKIRLQCLHLLSELEEW